MKREHAPLITALALFGVAALVLIVDTVWGVDVRLQAQTEEGEWITMGDSTGDDRYAIAPKAMTPLRVQANTTTTLQAIIVNDRPLALDTTVRVSTGDYPPILLREGHLSVPRFGETTVPFELNVTRVANGAPYPVRWEPKDDAEGTRFVTVPLQVQWADEQAYFTVTFEVYEP